MIGLKMVRLGRNVDNARRQDIILDTSLETLPIHWDGEFTVRVVPAAEDFGVSYVDIPHNLGYAPPALGWYYKFDSQEARTVTDFTRREKIPGESSPWAISLEGFDDIVRVTVTGFAIDMSDYANFNVEGYLYILKKDFKKL